ncbi:MAG: hypothetical protein V1899_11150 [Planctomycetota bacterium]
MMSYPELPPKGHFRRIPKKYFHEHAGQIDGRTVNYLLADQGVHLLSGRLRLRQVTRLSEPDDAWLQDRSRQPGAETLRRGKTMPSSEKEARLLAAAGACRACCGRRSLFAWPQADMHRDLPSHCSAGILDCTDEQARCLRYF